MAQIAAVLILLFVVACGGDKDDLTSPESRTDASPTATAGADGLLDVQRAAWGKQPVVGIVSARADDPRIVLVHDAVQFWNSQLEALGSGFRLGPVKQIVQSVPDALLERINPIQADGDTRLRPDHYAPLSRGLDDIDLAVMLSNGTFISFSTGILSVNGRTLSLAAIRAADAYPLTEPNVMPNVIAHEIGHSLGLGHNADPAMLMCGRPAECRPNTFISQERRYFPLTETEKGRLLQLYPTTWRPNP